MSSSAKDMPSSKRSGLNPNAAEYVPLSLRVSSASANNSDVINSKLDKNCGIADKGGNDSANLTTSDDQSLLLPDDITPDFSFLEDDISGCKDFAARSLDAFEYANVAKRVTTNGQLGTENSIQSMDGHILSDDCDDGFFDEFVGKQPLSDDGNMDAMEILGMEFPGFAAESLAGIYHANGCDLGLTIEMLTQLELQDDASPHWDVNAESSAAPNLNIMDFPVLSSPDILSEHAGNKIQQGANIHNMGEVENSFFSGHNVSGDSKTATDFAAVVRKAVSQQSDQGQYERKAAVDSSKSAQVPSCSFALNRKITSDDRLQIDSTTRQTHPLPPQLWLDTGETVANLYSDLRTAARDHARVRNAYFEQARQAYLVGNKALAKELGAKGQWHNGEMKAAHNKAGEAIFHHRNLTTSELQNHAPGEAQLIDLHGLHVNEAIPVLKRELMVLRNTSRLTCLKQHLLICVGTGHHTKGSRTPARLPLAVERFLVEDEHLDYSEIQPGMLQVVIK